MSSRSDRSIEVQWRNRAKHSASGLLKGNGAYLHQNKQLTTAILYFPLQIRLLVRIFIQERLRRLACRSVWGHKPDITKANFGVVMQWRKPGSVVYFRDGLTMIQAHKPRPFNNPCHLREITLIQSWYLLFCPAWFCLFCLKLVFVSYAMGVLTMTYHSYSGVYVDWQSCSSLKYRSFLLFSILSRRTACQNSIYCSAQTAEGKECRLSPINMDLVHKLLSEHLQSSNPFYKHKSAFVFTHRMQAYEREFLKRQVWAIVKAQTCS